VLKAITNLVLILLICVGASGISIFYSPILNESSSILDDSEELVLEASSEVNDILLNPDSIYIKYRTNKDALIDFNENYHFTAKIYKDDIIYKSHNIRHNGPVQIEFTKDTPYSVNINISKDILDLPNGEYKIEIIPNVIDDSIIMETLTLDVKFLSDVPYIPATNNIPEGKMGLNLYFLDNNSYVQQLVGITRFIDSNKKPLTSIIDELRKGPSFESGLNMNPIIGEYNYLSIKSSTLYIDLPSKESIYAKDSPRSEASMNAFIKTFGLYPGVDNIRFLVDYNRAKTFFNDKDVSISYTYNTENKSFLAYDSPNRYYLVECDLEEITEEMTIEDKVAIIIDSLKDSKYEYLSSTIPSEVKLLNSRLENDTLVLNFNSDFLEAYNSNNNLNRMMLDSVLFSFTSLNEVNKIRILVNNETVNRFTDVDLSTELPRPLYLNPEN